ncbi:MAG: TolB family protein [Cyanobium sp.]
MNGVIPGCRARPRTGRGDSADSPAIPSALGGWRVVALLPLLGVLLLPLAGCMGEMARPLPELDHALEQAGNGRAPSLGEMVLALISGRGGREQVVLVDLRTRLPVPLPGLNRPDAQPLSVSTDARGEKLALVRHRQGRTELVLYRRSLASVEQVPLQPDGVPRRVSLDPEGRSLAVEVSRDGLWQLDLITLP